MVEYYYNGYGYNLKINDYSNNQISKINPFRYRGYYYDNETNWYYLNTRYYNPITCRFISIDDINNLGKSNTINSYNLYTYCDGNPVSYIDDSGTTPKKIPTLSNSLDELEIKINLQNLQGKNNKTNYTLQQNSSNDVHNGLTYFVSCVYSCLGLGKTKITNFSGIVNYIFFGDFFPIEIKDEIEIIFNVWKEYATGIIDGGSAAAMKTYVYCLCLDKADRWMFAEF